MTYSVVIHEAEEGGFWAEVPALGACYSQGDTVEDTLEDLRGAIESHIHALLEDGQAIPRDEGLRVETVTVNVPTAA
jgi:predicted RNase H-like HicB family nuclease